MSRQRKTPAIGVVFSFAIVFLLGSYFTFASVQGDFGLFKRIQIEAEAEVLREEVEQLEAEVRTLRNKTRRLSDAFLDIDLLDQQAREVLGLARGDEVIIR